MEYTVNKLAKLSGVSTRTLRYYDQIGLLKPTRISSSGYRIYGKNEVNLLQQILFYKELGVSLDEIGKILKSPAYSMADALGEHLNALIKKKKQVELLIENVTKTISTLKGEAIMDDKEKFEGFKQRLIDDNEEKYGDEIRNKYGDNTIKLSNDKFKNMTEEQYLEIQRLSNEVNKTLKEAIEIGDASCDIAQKCCDLHRQWLCYFWPDGMYSKEAHLGLAKMYCDDERFRKYYDCIADGASEFLLEAMKIYCK